jgi:glycine/D-amino acid oxidase-like deaminating enzyme
VSPPVAVLGAGFLGVCVALECARRGIDVDLYDRRSDLITEAGRVCEGKIHLGYVYANDRSLRTARRLAAGAVLFERYLGHWLDLRQMPLDLSEPFHYGVVRHSTLTPADIEEHFRDVEAIVLEREEAAGTRYLGRPAGPVFQALTDSEIERHYDTTHIAAAYNTVERSVDTWRLAERLRAAVRASPRIRFHGEATVSAVRADGDGAFDVMWTSCHQHFKKRYASVVNALWGGRLAIDAGLGLTPRRSWLYRYKFGIRLETSPGTALPPTVTLVHGSFGDVVNFPSGLTYLSWYPTGMVGTSGEVVHPDWDTHFDDARKRAICDESIRQLAVLLKPLRQLREPAITARNVDGGVIFAWGATDIDDPHSELHNRHDIGVHTTGNYHSIDPGKYTMVPMLAMEVADRITGDGDCPPPNCSRTCNY